MPMEGAGKRLTVFVGEYDRYHRRSLAGAIMERAREEGLAGATMLRGIEGFGATGRLHTTRLLSASDDLPVVIEIVDRAQRIDAFLPILDEMITEGLVTIEEVQVQAHLSPRRHPLDDDPGVGLPPDPPRRPSPPSL
ncbi:MAG: DUF190 domain-containing protein [Acidimicrobiales bacterium]